MKKYIYLLKSAFAVLFVVSFFSIAHAQHPSIGGYHVYYGHLHNHTSYTDGTGTPAQAYNYAKDTAGLDFFGLSDHDYIANFTELTPAEYSDVIAQANAYNADGVFTTFYGFEWSSNIGIGHITITNSDNLITNQVYTTFGDLISWLNSTDNVVAFYNHPGRYDTNGLYSYNSTIAPSIKLVGMELWNSGNGFWKYYENDGYIPGDNKGDYDEALSKGWILGASGSGDDHSGTWGTAQNCRMAILADSLTRKSLLTAMKARRFYSTLESDISLSFKINGQEMGSAMTAGTYSLQIQGADGGGEIFTKVVLYDKNRNPIKTWTPNTSTFNITDNLTVAPNEYYYVKVIEADSSSNSGQAISSPIFISSLVTNGSQTIALCSGESTTIHNNVIGGIGPYTYNWSPAAGLNSITDANPVASPSVSTVYTVVVTDGYGGSATNHATVNVNNCNTPQQYLISRGTAWKYNDTGADLGTIWKDVGYNDASWSGGNAQLGYGSINAESIVTTINYGGVDTNRFPTYYFRKTFNYTVTGTESYYEINALVDDGAVFYINGIEVQRMNMPAGTIAYGTFATTYASETYKQFIIPLSSIKNGSNTIAVEVHQSSKTSSDLGFNMDLIVHSSLIDLNSAWKYMDSGTDLGTSWKDVGYDDSYWSSGNALLGYGLIDAEPVITTLSYGPDMNNKYPTTYFRRTFNYAVTGNEAYYKINALVDDGAVFYINGLEVQRWNMPAGTIAYGTYATTYLSETYQQFIIPAFYIHNGSNTIAVEVHQCNSTSSDLGFNMELIVQNNPVSNNDVWKYNDTGTDLGTTWKDVGYNDASWSSGNAQLGYGVIDAEPIMTTISYGSVSTNKYPTYYFRRTFNYTVSGNEIYYELNALVDDGAIFYINGIEVKRVNLPSGTISYNTFATTNAGETYQQFLIPAYFIRNGSNTIAVEVHQVSVTDTDLGFNMNLIARRKIIERNEAWKYNATGIDLGTSWKEEGYNDASWPSGNAQLGYGVIDAEPIVTTISYGSNINDKYRTYYFRKTFNYAVTGNETEYAINALIDDGAVFYINGIEVKRLNLNMWWNSYWAYALTAANESYVQFIVPANVIKNGINTIAVEVHQVSGSDTDLGFNMDLIVHNKPLPLNDVWKYNDTGADLGTSWKDVAYNDSTWSSGNALLGYGEITAEPVITTINYGGVDTNKYPTCYFRKTFDYPITGNEAYFTINTLVDDGAVFYINGVEALRVNLPSGTISYTTLATTYASETYQYFIIPAYYIQNGSNTIAVEVHQNSLSSSDLGFNMELTAWTSPSISQIHFGTSNLPLDGTTITWRGAGTADSIRWGYDTLYLSGRHAGVMRSNYTNQLYDYNFPVLLNDTVIHYSLWDSFMQTWTSDKVYHTAKVRDADHFTFTAMGDSRTNWDDWNTLSEAVRPSDFVLFLGDLVDAGGTVSSWDTWFDHGVNFFENNMVYYIIGNHDVSGDQGAINFRNLMVQPPNPGNELYYSFTVGNSVFIALNSEDPGNTTQYNWLINTLESNKDKKWRFVYFHKPFYTSPSHGSEMDAYFATWWKAFDDYGVEVIFNGHTHNYQRTVPINRNISQTSGVANYGHCPLNGRCQIVTGAAGAPMSGPGSGWFIENSASMLEYVNIEIAGDSAILKVFDQNNALIDSFMILNTLDLNITASATEICQGDSVTLTGSGAQTFSWDHGVNNGIPFVPLQTEIYTLVGSNADQCADTLNIQISVHPKYLFTENHSICGGQTYIWQGTAYTVAGNYTANYQSIYGCDSIYTLSLTVNPGYAFTEDHNICDGQTYTWHGVNYTMTGTYTASYQTTCGIDSIYTLHLTVDSSYLFTENDSICAGDTITWHGADYTMAGIYIANYQTTCGTDSIYTLNLFVNASPADMFIYAASDTLCYNNSTDIYLGNSQNGISYQLQKNGFDWGAIQTGNGGTLTFNTGTLTTTTPFTVKATNLITSCHIIFDTIITLIVSPPQTFYRDNDNDGYGDNSTPIQACTTPGGYVSDNTDCNDSNYAVHPGATEVCNGFDDDCDTYIDEGLTLTFYRDNDGDGYGNINNSTQACSLPVGYVSDNTDCNDSNYAVHPGATEICNNMDDDCDTYIDEGVLMTYYKDADGDGYGNSLNTIHACLLPVGYVTNNTDCDDTHNAIHPGAPEICNGIDDDCDGSTDEQMILYAFNENYQICTGETYTWHGTDYTDAGIYTANYLTVYGCDSIYTLHLTVNPVYSFTENDSIYAGQTYSWHGASYTSGGTYSANYQTMNGCDSIYTLNLTVTGYLISGKTRYAAKANNGSPIPNPPTYSSTKYNIDQVIVILKNTGGLELARDTSDALGNYQFSGIQNGSYILSYDKYTADTMQVGNSVDAIDLTLLKYYIGTDTLVDPSRNFYPKYRKAANVDNNTTINAIDISRVKAKIGSPYNATKNFPKGNWVGLDTTVTVAGSSLNIDLMTICYGDYNASSSKYRDSLATWSGVKSLPSEIIITSEEYLTTSDPSYIEIPLQINMKMTEFSSMGLELSYPNKDFKLVSVFMPKTAKKNDPVKINPSMEEILADDNDLLVTDEDGIIRVVYATIHHFDVAANEELIRLGFRSIKNPEQGELNFELSGTGVIGDKYGEVNDDAYLLMPRIMIQGQANEDAGFEFAAYPNPFKNETTLTYNLPENGTIILKVYNAIGELVSELVNESQISGKHSVEFSPNNLPSGMYSCKLEFSGLEKSKSIILKLIH